MLFLASSVDTDREKNTCGGKVESDVLLEELSQEDEIDEALEEALEWLRREEPSPPNETQEPGLSQRQTIKQSLILELSQMVKADQDAIRIAIEATQTQERKEANKRKEELLQTHTNRLKKIMGEHGFPGFNLVGAEGSHDFWLLVQHSDHDLKFQQAVLAKMKEEVDRKNANAENYAYLFDRVAKNSGQLQRYGTQVTYSEREQAIPLPLEESKLVNRRRASTGLGPIEEYLNGISKMHFEINQQILESKGITKPLMYAPSYSEKNAFESPK